MNKRAVGSAYEAEVAHILEGYGYRILERNYRNRRGEIDLIALHQGCLVFIEVKYRKNESRGWPSQAVNPKKQRVICRVADYYYMTHGQYENADIRFDVVSILGSKIRIYQNAFEYRR